MTPGLLTEQVRHAIREKSGQANMRASPPGRDRDDNGACKPMYEEA